MKKRLLTVISVIIFLISCGTGNDVKQSNSFISEFKSTVTTFKEKQKTIKSMKEFKKFKEDRTAAFKALLDKFKDAAENDSNEIVRSKILIATGNIPSAIKKIEKVIKKGGDLKNRAKMVRVQLYSIERKYDDALKMFKEIEGTVDRNSDFYNVYTTFAFYSSDPAIRKEYSEKLINEKTLPKELKNYRHMFYANIASIAKNEGNIDEARKVLKQGLESIDYERGKKSLSSELSQLEFIGKKAPSITAETWINSKPLSLDSLTGKVVIIDFWAPWCGPCRSVIPSLIKEYNEKKDNGLVVIGFTKLYGSYRDDISNKGKVEREKEIELIRGFVKRFKMSYPVAISDEGSDFEKYKITGIPTMIFIDKEGKVDFIKIGSGNIPMITKKIEKLLNK